MIEKVLSFHKRFLDFDTLVSTFPYVNFATEKVLGFYTIFCEQSQALRFRDELIKPTVMELTVAVSPDLLIFPLCYPRTS